MEFVTRLFAKMLFCILIGVLCKGQPAMCSKWDMSCELGVGWADDLHLNTAK